MTNRFLITNTTMSGGGAGSEDEYTFPADVISVILQASGGDITLAHVSSGATFTLADGASLNFNLRGLPGYTLYCDGTAGVVLQAIEFYGLNA